MWWPASQAGRVASYRRVTQGELVQRRTPAVAACLGLERQPQRAQTESRRCRFIKGVRRLRLVAQLHNHYGL